MCSRDYARRKAKMQDFVKIKSFYLKRFCNWSSCKRIKKIHLASYFNLESTQKNVNSNVIEKITQLKLPFFTVWKTWIIIFLCKFAKDKTRTSHKLRPSCSTHFTPRCLCDTPWKHKNIMILYFNVEVLTFPGKNM